MNRRKGTNPRRRNAENDQDFNRNSNLLTRNIKDDTTTPERQLFDPRLDNPISFNKDAKQNTEIADKKTPPKQQTRALVKKAESPQQQNGKRRPAVTPGRKLWSADDNTTSAPASVPPPHLIASTVPSTATVDIQPNVIPQQLSTSTLTVEKKPPPAQQPNLSPAEIERKTKYKALISSIRSIESQLEQLMMTSHALVCFQDDHDATTASNNSRETRRNPRMDKANDDGPDMLTQLDIHDTEKVWKEKIQLHLALAEQYLKVLACDLAYAEKKGLESLCWKRAIYSLVEQFRSALKRSATMIETATTNAATSKTGPKKVTSAFAAMLMEEGLEDVTEIPIIHEGGGMTFIKPEPKEETPKSNEREKDELELQIKLAKTTLQFFLDYLDLADEFYRKLATFLKSVEDESAEDEDDVYLNQWRRTKRYKWYNCVPLRGDLARYRWSCMPKDNEQEDIVCKWNRKTTFEEAWKRYFLAIWLTPGKGNLYFNLTLLLTQQLPSMIIQGDEFHKLYLSTRSLMVRRNGFLNARESMLVLFEGNRRWVQKNLMDSNTSNARSKDRSRRLQQPGSSSLAAVTKDKDNSIPALFIRLHGMLFTKIGLDEFPTVKRQFFDALFEKKKERALSLSPVATTEKTVQETLAGNHMFWLETIVMCLSSLYAYDYANSKLTKLITNHSNNILYPERDPDSVDKTMEEVSESVLFGFEIDLLCQIAVNLFSVYLDPNTFQIGVPQLPPLPYIKLGYKQNKDFLFGLSSPLLPSTEEPDNDNNVDDQAWLIYIEVLLHWIVLNGICMRSSTQTSLWEKMVGDIESNFINTKLQQQDRPSKISPSFWPLLLRFLNKLLSEISEEDKYDMVNQHLMGTDKVTVDKQDETVSAAEYEFAKSIFSILGKQPDLPEEEYMRGLGWVDEIHGRFIKLGLKDNNNEDRKKYNVVTRRKLKILDYGFTLVKVKHLEDVLYYDPVQELFAIPDSVEDRALLSHQKSATSLAYTFTNNNTTLYDDEGDDYKQVSSTIADMDDDVLFSNENEPTTNIAELDDHDDDIMTQLKKRREQLQSIVASTEAEQKHGFRRLPARAKEREARLSYLCKRIIPGKTVLVLDTNCFIGHIDHIEKLLSTNAWSIVVPLVVVTELDGLRSNAQRLGIVAEQGIQLIETTLANKPKQSNLLRIQTSHNNFMNDISIRSEQFMFSETDKNLDDLVLSCCLWWISQQQQQQHSSTVTADEIMPVCLVTGDRNLSVKARARDVEVVPVSAIMQLTPK